MDVIKGKKKKKKGKKRRRLFIYLFIYLFISQPVISGLPPLDLKHGKSKNKFFLSALGSNIDTLK